jgi:plastocyanin
MRRIVCTVLGVGLLGCGGDGGGTEPNPVPASIAIAVTGGTGNMTAAGQTRTLTATVRDQNNNTMPGAQVGWVSNATGAVTVSPATGTSTTATAVANGTATITASAGSVDQTVQLTVATGGGGPPATAGVTANTNSQFVPGQVTIADDGTVTWTFQSVTHNVQFAAAAGAPTNIGNTANATESRTFNTPGTFEYSCSLHPGMNGSVVVAAP